VLGHCKFPIQLENGFLLKTDFIISPSIEEPMLGLEWLTKNAARWNFLDGTIIIKNPTFSVRDHQSSHADLGKEMSVRSVNIQRNDCARLTSGHVVFPISTSPVSKEVLFHVIDKICNAAKTNSIIEQMLDNFIRNSIKDTYFSQNNGKHSDLVSEHGDFIRLILTHDRFTGKPKKSADCRFEDILSERGDLIPKIIELDGLNLPTLFGKTEDSTNVTYDSDDFKYSDLFDENGDVYADTLWSSPDHGDMLV